MLVNELVVEMFLFFCRKKKTHLWVKIGLDKHSLWVRITDEF